MATAMTTSMWNRMYSDFFMPSRLPQFEHLLETALGAGYCVCSIRDYLDEARRGKSLGGRYMIIRCDVDTDPGTAAALFRIITRYGASSSFYFRLSTLDIDLMQAIENSGSEASYHYEEISTWVKREGLTSRVQVEAAMEPIRLMFTQNLTHVRALTGLPMVTVAAHGDFVNRRLGIPNSELINGDLRNELGIEIEVYDVALERQITSRHSDTLYPAFWKGKPPYEALKKASPLVYVLVHPRHWRRNISANFRDDTCRVYQGLRFALAERNRL